MTNEFPIQKSKWVADANNQVIRAWSFFRHYGFVIRHFPPAIIKRFASAISRRILDKPKPLMP
jgi:hypothetical protein